MAGNIKGITVEIGGDTSKLGKAIESSEKQTRDLQKELKQVNTALKFNPNSIELITQKQKILTDQIEATKDKLNTLKEAEAQVEAQFNAGEIGEEQFRAFQREIIETESKLKTYTSQLEETGKKASALDELTETIKDQEKAVDELKDEYKNAVLMYGENSDEANKLAKEIDELSSELNENKSKMAEANSAADKLDHSLEEVEDSSDKATGGFTVMKGALANLVAQGIQLAITGLKNLASAALDAYKEFDEGQDNMIKATGATGEAAEKLTESYKNVSKSVVGDLGAIGSALGEVNTRFGWTGKELEDATVQFMKFSEITGVDATQAVQLVSRAMENAGIDSKEYASVLDQLAVAGQASGTSIDKLAENLTKFGLPMREMGLSTTESIAMLAQFEKAGVNTEVALAGMRKALQNWSKDGKVASKEFEKVVKQIKDAPNATEATALAMEHFGNKAGPELADAIKTGRFEYSDFLELIEGSAGAVTNTYEETQDGFDKINLAIQGARAELGDFVGQLLTKYQPQIEGAITAGVNLFKSATQFVIDNFDTIKRTLEVIIPIIAAVFATNKIAGFISSISTLKGAVSGLWAVMAANPIGLVITAFAGVTAAAIALNKANDDYIESVYGLTKEEQALIDKINEEAEAIDNAAEARRNANSAIDAEYGQNLKLWDELQNIVDANGKIKKGYEDRAAVITGLLAESLGVEIEIVDGQIKKYGELKQSIEEVISTKRAEALLEANKKDYADAISKSAEAYTTYTKAVGEASKTQEELRVAEEKAAELKQALTGDTMGLAESLGALENEYNNQLKVVETLRGKYNDQSDAVSKAESNYFKYASTIQNYEGVMAAMANGDVAALSQALDRLSNDFLTADNATEQMLKNQLANFREQYKNMKAAVDAGMPGVTQAQVDAMGDLVAQAENELNKLAPKAGAAGKKAGDEHAKGVESTAEANKTAGAKVSKDTDTGLNTADTKASGTKKGNEYAEGVKSTAGTGNSAGKTVADDTNKGMVNADTKASGKKKGDEYASGVRDTAGTANAAGKTVADKAKSGAESVSMKKSGEKAGDQYDSGISSKTKATITVAKAIANSGLSGFAAISARNTGVAFGQGFLNGISSMSGSIISQAQSIASRAVSIMRSVLNSHSPSRVTESIGEDFDAGFIGGIKNKAGDAVKAARNMATETVNELTDIELDPFSGGSIGVNFDRQLESTFNPRGNTPDFSVILEKLDSVTAAIAQYSGNAIVLDTGVLVGETINQIDDGLANVYGMKARGI